MRNWAYALVRHIDLLFSKRLDRFCYIIGFENIRIHRPHVIGFVAHLFFSTLESGFKNIRSRWRIFRMRVDAEVVSGKNVSD